MGREVRMVPESWEHPKRSDGEFKALFEGYSECLKDFVEEKAKWDSGVRPIYARGCKSFEEFWGEAPDPNDYMPEFKDGEATHLMMYENTSEGTPISPAFDAPERLARWLADNNASAFADQTASYEAWLRMCKAGFSVSAVVVGGELKSGVEAL